MQFGREWTKFAVRFREVSGLESVRLERVDCILPILIASRIHVHHLHHVLFELVRQRVKSGLSSSHFTVALAGLYKVFLVTPKSLPARCPPVELCSISFDVVVSSFAGTKPVPRVWEKWNLAGLEPRDMRKDEQIKKDASKGAEECGRVIRLLRLDALPIHLTIRTVHPATCLSTTYLNNTHPSMNVPTVPTHLLGTFKVVMYVDWWVTVYKQWSTNQRT